jgi:serine/threonine-protein kinase
LAVGLGVWYLLQPPSADTLFSRITQRTHSDSIESLLAAQDDIEEFLSRYPGDSRASLLRDNLKEIELHRLQRRFDLRVKGLADTDNLLPIEQAFLEAVQEARVNPERTAAKLDALIALYSEEEASGPTGRCLELARRRLAQLRMQLAEDAALHLGFLEERLQTAEELSTTQPEEARRIYEAIIELYGEKPWASEPVTRARESLKNLPSGDEST